MWICDDEDIFIVFYDYFFFLIFFVWKNILYFCLLVNFNRAVISNVIHILGHKADNFWFMFVNFV